MHLEQNQEQRGYLVLSSKELVDQLSNADLQCDTALQPTKKTKNYSEDKNIETKLRHHHLPNNSVTSFSAYKHTPTLQFLRSL